jgi:hypothetical protein
MKKSLQFMHYQLRLYYLFQMHQEIMTNLKCETGLAE